MNAIEQIADVIRPLLTLTFIAGLSTVQQQNLKGVGFKLEPARYAARRPIVPAVAVHVQPCAEVLRQVIAQSNVVRQTNTLRLAFAISSTQQIGYAVRRAIKLPTVEVGMFGDVSRLHVIKPSNPDSSTSSSETVWEMAP